MSSSAEPLVAHFALAAGGSVEEDTASLVVSLERLGFHSMANSKLGKSTNTQSSFSVL